MTHKKAWKFLRIIDGKICSDYDESQWTIGVWREYDGTVKECVGLNASKMTQDALGFVAGDVLAQVEYSGKIVDSGNKITCQKMRIVKAWKWDKKHSVRMAIFVAEKVLGNYESNQPGDDRPRKAIEAAKAVVENDNEGNRTAARSAAESAWFAVESAARGAARSAESAWSARSAWSAAESAWFAVESAARGAARSAETARSAAESAAESADKLKSTIHRFIVAMMSKETTIE